MIEVLGHVQRELFPGSICLLFQPAFSLVSFLHTLYLEL